MITPFRLVCGLLSLSAIIGLSGCADFPGDVIDWHGGHDGPSLRHPVNALSFDGQDDYVLVPNHRELQIHPGGSFTIEAWVKSDGWGRWNWVASHATSNENNDFLFGFDNSRMRFITCDLSNDLFGRTRLTTGKWYHVAGVQDVENGTMKVYLDGELEGTLRLSGTPETTAGDLFIGAREWYGTGRAVELFDGIIHELRIWRTALSQSQIRDLMKVRLAGGDDDNLVIAGFDRRLIAYWPLNEGYGPIAHDQSGHSHHGRIFGGAAWVRVEDPLR